jgi:hypothetical protein
VSCGSVIPRPAQTAGGGGHDQCPQVSDEPVNVLRRDHRRVVTSYDSNLATRRPDADQRHAARISAPTCTLRTDRHALSLRSTQDFSLVQGACGSTPLADRAQRPLREWIVPQKKWQSTYLAPTGPARFKCAALAYGHSYVTVHATVRGPVVLRRLRRTVMTEEERAALATDPKNVLCP